MVKLTQDELYCVAKTLQGQIFGDGSFYYGCRHCKIQKTKCAPDNKPRPDMYIDRVRDKLMEITGVELWNECSVRREENAITNAALSEQSS